MQFNIIAIMGKSASGKTLLQKELCNILGDKVHKIISTTTRPQREGEVDHCSYHFISSREFAKKIFNCEMLEASEFNNWFYGTEISSLNKDKINIGVFNPEGVLALAEDSRLNVKVVYLNTEDKIRLIRSLNRETYPDCLEICRRFFADEKDFSFEFFEELKDLPVKLTTIDNNSENLEDIVQIAEQLQYFILNN